MGKVVGLGDESLDGYKGVEGRGLRDGRGGRCVMWLAWEREGEVG